MRHCGSLPAQSGAASSVDPVSIASDTTEVMLPDQHINEVTITKRQTVRSMGGAINGQAMLKGELFKAACCNLGESFVNNPSVDVNYSDAARERSRSSSWASAAPMCRCCPSCCPTSAVRLLPLPWATSLDLG